MQFVLCVFLVISNGNVIELTFFVVVNKTLLFSLKFTCWHLVATFMVLYSPLCFRSQNSFLKQQNPIFRHSDCNNCQRMLTPSFPFK